MFAFSQVQPETTGVVTDMEVPFSDYIKESASEAIRLSPVASAYRWSQLYQEENDPDQQKLSAEQANKLYATDTLRFDEPITETAASMLHDRHIAMADARFNLSNDNHNIAAGAVGMTTGMIASLVDPVNLALMFLNPVGSEPLNQTRTVASMGMLGRGAYFEEKALQGLITRETLAKIVPFPKLAETVIQGASFMTLAEAPKQIFAVTEHEDVGDPLMNIVQGTALAGAIHLGLEGLGRLWKTISSSTKEALYTKAMDQFVKGDDYNLHSLALTDEAFSDYHYERAMLQENDITWKEFGGWKQDPIVPTTEPEPERQFSSVLDEIRQKKARTKEQIQELFPKAELTREQAADLRRQAWGEPAPEQVRQKHVQDYFQDQADPQKWISAKRQARIEAERNMPNPIPAAIVEQAHAVVEPEEKTIAAVEKQTDTVKKKIVKVKKQTPESIAKRSGFELSPAISYEGMPSELLAKMPEQPLHFTDKRSGSKTEGLSITLPPGSTLADFNKAIKLKVKEGYEPPLKQLIPTKVSDTKPTVEIIKEARDLVGKEELRKRAEEYSSLHLNEDGKKSILPEFMAMEQAARDIVAEKELVVKEQQFEKQQAKLKEADKVKPNTEAIDSAANCLTKKIL